MALSLLWGGMRRGLRRPSSESLMPLLDVKELDPIEEALVRPFDTIYLSNEEKEQISKQYISLCTEVYMRPSVVQLYFKHPHLTPRRWIYQATGVPVVVWLTGKKLAYLFIADIKTGLTLWRTVINKESKYTVKAMAFHTLETERLKVGIRFACWESGRSVYQSVKKVEEKYKKSKKGSWWLPWLKQGQDRFTSHGDGVGEEELPPAIRDDPCLPCRLLPQYEQGFPHKIY